MIQQEHKLSLLEGIKARRTTPSFQSNPVPRDIIEEILKYGIWAPNHHLTEPWRFIGIGEETKIKLAERYRELRMAEVADRMDERSLADYGERNYRTFLAKPTILSISCQQIGDEQQQREDYAATCCSIQNILLAAWAHGVGMHWYTGPLTRDRVGFELLGLDFEKEYIVGFFYVGYPARIPGADRKPFHEVFGWTS
ncbi:nitroreductase [Chloroflexi bacterium TSY]|nr:nitroreductase [Chloroflexi bacterium TSY]